MNDIPGQTPPAGGSEHPVDAPWSGAEGVWNLGEGDAAQPWWAFLPDQAAREHIAAKQYANPAELALANYNLTRLQTGDTNVVNLPGENATPEQWNDFYTKMGRPETPDAYDFKFGEGAEADDTMVKFGKSLFHSMGLNPTQAQAAADKWNEFAMEQNAAALEAQKAANDAELDALRSRWGADLDKNKAAGKRVVEALGLENDLIERVENQIGSAAIVELLATIGRKSDEGAFKSGSVQNDPNDPSTMSREAAQAKVEQLQSDKDFQAKYTDAKHPGHAEAVALMERLYARL